MGELFDQFVIELKNLAKALKIEEVKKAPHHSPPIKPRGHVSQVMKGTEQEEPSQQRTYYEWLAVNRVESPLRRRHGSYTRPERNVGGGYVG